MEYLFPRSYMPIKIQTKEIMMLKGEKKLKGIPPQVLKSASYVSREDHTWLQLASYTLDTGKRFLMPLPTL